MSKAEVGFCVMLCAVTLFAQVHGQFLSGRSLQFGQDGFGGSAAHSYARHRTPTGNFTTTGYAPPAGFQGNGTQPSLFGYFVSGAFDGQSLWLSPYLEPNAWTFNVTTLRWTQVPSITGKSGGGGYYGAVFDGSRVWFIPAAASSLVGISVTTLALTKVFIPSSSRTIDYRGAAFDGVSLWLAPCRVQPSNLIVVSTVTLAYSSVSLGSFSGDVSGGAIFDGTRVWVLPNSFSTLFFVVVSDTKRQLQVGPVASYIRGAAFDGRYLWLVPDGVTPSAKIVQLVDTTLQATASQIQLTQNGFTGGCYDGLHVWLVPYYSNVLLTRIHADTRMVQYFPTSVYPVNTGMEPYFYGAIYDGASIWLVPCTSLALVQISLLTTTTVSTSSSQTVSQTLTKRLIAYMFRSQDGVSFSAGVVNPVPIGTNPVIRVYPLSLPSNFFGGAFDGAKLWLAPNSYSYNITVFDIHHRRFTAVALGNVGPFRCTIFDGRLVWFIPYLGGKVTVINPVTMTIQVPLTLSNLSSYVGGTFDGLSVWVVTASSLHGKVVQIDTKNYAATIHMNSLSQTANSYFCGALFDGDRVWLIPRTGGITVAIAVEQPAFMIGYSFSVTSSAFASGVFDGTSVWMFPENGGPAGRIITATNTLSSFPLINGSFVGGTFDGQRVWMAPYDAATALISFDPTAPNVTLRAYRSWPAALVVGFMGAVFDGRSLWLVPGNGNALVEVTSRTSTSSRTHSLTTFRSSTVSLSSKNTLTQSLPGSATIGNFTTSEARTRSTSHDKTSVTVWPSRTLTLKLSRSATPPSNTWTVSATLENTSTTSESPSLLLSLSIDSESPSSTRSPSHDSPTPPTTASMTTTQSLTVPQVPNVALLSAVITTTAAATNQAVVSVATALGATAASPGAAMQASRSLSVIALSQCTFDYDGKVDFPLSLWPGFAIGAGIRGSYLRGAVVAGLGTMVGAATVGAVVVLLGTLCTRPPDGTHAVCHTAALLRFPGVLLIVVGVALDGLVTCAVSTALHGEWRVLDTTLAFLALVFCTVFVVATWMIGTRASHVCCQFVHRESNEPSNVFVSKIDLSLRGEKFWVPRPTFASDATAWEKLFSTPKNTHSSLGSFYKKYRDDARWFYVADIILTVLVSGVKGTMPTTLQGCYIAIAVVTFLCVVGLALAIHARPYAASAKNGLLIVSNGLTVLGAGLVVGALATTDATLLSAGQLCALAAGYLSIGNVIIAVYNEISALRTSKTSARVTTRVPTKVLTLPDDDVPQTEMISVADTIVGTPAFTNSELDKLLLDFTKSPATDGSIHRTEEGQMLYEEIDSMLNLGLHSSTTRLAL